MAKASDIKINQPITPISSQQQDESNKRLDRYQSNRPSTMQNIKPVAKQKKTINTDPLWKQGLKSVKNVTDTWDKNIEQTKANLKNEWES